MRSGQQIVFYDGECPFCVTWVKFLLDRDGDDRLRFAALQSNWTRRFFEKQGAAPPGMGNIIVWDGERFHHKSDAVVVLGEALPGVWSGLHLLRHVPPKWRDAAYTFIGDRRYKWFGKYPERWIPTEADRGKFLDLKAPEAQTGKHGDSPEDDPHRDPGQRDL